MSLATALSPRSANIFNVTRNFAFVGIIALGMTTVIITGGIDLSVGAVLVLSAMITGMTMAAGYPIWVAIPWRSSDRWRGLFNGIMIAFVGVPSFVVTLGTLSVARSLAMGVVEQQDGLSVRRIKMLLDLGGGSTLGIRTRFTRSLFGRIDKPSPIAGRDWGVTFCGRRQ